MDKAIQKSIEGGYPSFLLNKNKDGSHILLPSDLLTPLFWQALGKSLGWYDDSELIPNSWSMFWHKFIDHLIAGKSAESFFEELLK